MLREMDRLWDRAPRARKFSSVGPTIDAKRYFDQGYSPLQAAEFFIGVKKCPLKREDKPNE